MSNMNNVKFVKEYPQLTNGQINYATIVAFFAWTFSTFDFILFGTLLPIMSADFGWDPATGAQVAMYISFGVLAVSFTVGPITEKIGRSNGLMVVTAGTAIASLLTGFTPLGVIGIIYLVVVRAISGLGYQEQAINSAYMNEITTNVKNKGFRYGFVQGGWPMGAMLAAIVATLFLENLGWRAVYWIGTVPEIIIILLRIKLKESPKYLEMREVKKLLKEGKKEEAIELGNHYGINVVQMTEKSTIGQLFAPDFRRHTIGLFAANILIWFPCQVFSVLGTTILTSAKGFEFSNALLMAIATNLVAYTGYLVSGAIGDKFGRRNVIFAFWFTSGIAYVLMMYLTSGFFTTMLLYMLGTFCMLGGWATVMTYQGESYPTRIRANAVSFLNAWGYVGAIISSGIFSWAIGAFGIVHAAVIAGAIPACLGAIFMLLCHNVKPGQKLEDIAQ